MVIAVATTAEVFKKVRREESLFINVFFCWRDGIRLNGAYACLPAGQLSLQEMRSAPVPGRSSAVFEHSSLSSKSWPNDHAAPGDGRAPDRLPNERAWPSGFCCSLRSLKANNILQIL